MSYLHDATPTWNGFNYQGKIALCVVLDKLILLNNNPVNEYSLELEWLEDFAIKRNQEYLTIHQVKNYGADNLSDYKDALQSLLIKTLKVVSAEEIKSIITERKNVNKPVLAAQIITELKTGNIIDANEKINVLADLTNLPLSQALTKYKNRLTDKLNQLKSIANNSLALENCYLHIAEPVNNFNSASIKALDTITPFNTINGFNDAVDKIILYQYSNGNNTCNNGEIENLIEDRIKIYLININGKDQDSIECQPEHLKKIRLELLGIIDKNISLRHQAIRNDNPQQIQNISFTEIKGTIDNGKVPATKYYHSYMLKEAYSSILDSVLELNKAAQDKCQILLDLTDNIYNLYPTEKFSEFCQKIRPHTSTPRSFHNLISEDGLRESFFKFFTELLNYDQGAFIKDKNGNYSLITSISENAFDENRAKQIYTTIKQNEKEMPPFMFNVETLVGNIGEGNGGQKFSEIVPKTTTAEESYSTKITISEDFKIVDIKDEITRLKPPII